ncbi:hypothetical protein WA026_014982 [Henosepilachna vigintioctopunctata]|uniref:RNA cytidine acetyltransferase n=1 Tax=Henosepilachna vigintioctopunctata TaxID=420089 RepID=A0AAW1U7W6_9CUCU
MGKKKIDKRIRTLIENGVKLQYRTFIVVVGDKGRDQVVLLHHMLAGAEDKSRPSVLWCYKKEFGFNNQRRKLMKKLQHKIQVGMLNVDEDDPFELFLVSTTIRFCHYMETQRILGSTYGMCILQDFEALTPNLLARTIETVEGGGLIVILLKSVSSLRQFYSMSMDVHQKLRTEAHKDVVCRFNERFFLSLVSCERCLIVDDNLSVLPLSSYNLNITVVPTPSEISDAQSELNKMKAQFRKEELVDRLINCCKTLDQAKAFLTFINALKEKSIKSTVSLTAARGRGKSASMGLAVAAAIGFCYTSIFVTSPSPENLNTFFEFVFKGFDALNYQENKDYNIIRSTNPDFNKAIMRVDITRNNRQTIQYIHPTDNEKLFQADLLVIDEAAAIPLPCVRAMLGSFLVFLASTINGYEGTGRSLSLKLLQQLRTKAIPSVANTNGPSINDSATVIGRTLHEVTLEESIRYKPGDHVEKWLTKLLCLDSTSVHPMTECPALNKCDLYYINRDTLFSYHKASESFLQKLVALYVASHYKNTPNDLQMMSDAPAHHLFCLLGPIDSNTTKLPEILVIIQVCLEGQISEESAKQGLCRGKKASGDLIPWTIAQEFLEPKFATMSGLRIVRIATHPDHQGMGYGARALSLLKQYYEFKIPYADVNVEDTHKDMKYVDENEGGLLNEQIEPRKSLPPLLLKLNERMPERLDYLGVSYGLTEQLLKFWKRSGFVPVYLGQSKNDLTGEHSCIMLNVINVDKQGGDQYLTSFWNNFRDGFIDLLPSKFNKFSTNLALSVLSNNSMKLPKIRMSESELNVCLKDYHLKLLVEYINNVVNYHSINRLIPRIARLYFSNQMGDVQLSQVQMAILLGMGLQLKTLDDLEEELELPSSQLMGVFNKALKKVVKYFKSILEEGEKSFPPTVDTNRMAVAKSVKSDLEKPAISLQKKKKKPKNKILDQLMTRGSEEEHGKMSFHNGTNNAVKSGQKRLKEQSNENDQHFKKRRKKSKQKN